MSSAQALGTIRPMDLSVLEVRAQLGSLLVLKSTPFSGDGEKEPFKSFTVTAACVNHAVRVHAEAYQEFQACLSTFLRARRALSRWRVRSRTTPWARRSLALLPGRACRIRATQRPPWRRQSRSLSRRRRKFWMPGRQAHCANSAISFALCGGPLDVLRRTSHLSST